MEVQGWVVIGLALVLFGYLIPYVVRGRQQLAESRVEDRFSGTMRVVVTGTTAKRSAAGGHHGRPEARPYLHDPRRRTEKPAVTSSTSYSEHAATDARRLAALRAARAAEISRRKAAAERRLILTLVLLAAAVVGWAVVGLTSANLMIALTPTVLFGGVLVLGRRAAKIATRRNIADRTVMAQLTAQGTARPRTTAAAGRPARATATPSGTTERTDAGPARDAGTVDSTETATLDAPTVAGETPATASDDVAANDRVETASTEPTAATHPGAGESDTGGSVEADDVASPAESDRPRRWTPVPVPVPAYTLKPTAPRRDVTEHSVEQSAAAAADASDSQVDADVALEGSPYSPLPMTARQAASARGAGAADLPPTTGGLDLDTVLARRRAVGA